MLDSDRPINKRLCHIEKKQKQFKIKITSYIKGDLKNKFTSDCINRKVTEADMVRDVLDVYYNAIKCNPCLVDKSVFEIKTYIKDKLRL